MDTQKLIDLDLRHVWHPCSQMKDYEDFPPIPVVAARGSRLVTADGREIIDAISSWWCKSLGHTHPRIKAAVAGQMEKFEHVILANTCNETIAELSERLARLCPPLDKVFYADNGSTAVEIAMKMSLQYHAQTGAARRRGFASLRNGYHGETILTLATGDCDLYSSPYASILPRVEKLDAPPLCVGPDGSGWNSGTEAAAAAAANWERQLDEIGDTLSALVFEPIVQGAGNMRVHHPHCLTSLRRLADKHGFHLIADEIMTGFGRTGKALACEHAGITPDFITISKGLTAGWGPMSAVLCSTEVYEAFYDDYFSGRAFMHSNTFTGHALSAAAALEASKIYEEEDTFADAARRGRGLRARMERAAAETGALVNVRGVGFVAAADIVDPSTGAPFPRELRTGYRCYRRAVELGALLRPIGDTIYFLPPLNTSEDDLDQIAEIAIRALKDSLG